MARVRTERTKPAPTRAEQERRASLVRAAEEFVTVIEGKPFHFSSDDARRLAFFGWRLAQAAQEQRKEPRCP